MDRQKMVQFYREQLKELDAKLDFLLEKTYKSKRDWEEIEQIEAQMKASKWALENYLENNESYT
jgi:hypothetical protein